MNDRLHIRLLGGLSVSRGGEALALPTRKAAALLAVLAVQADRVVTRERLADLLWPRSPPAQARGSLRQALAQLRRVLGDAAAGVLVATADGLRLHTEHVEIDVADLEAALDDGSPAALARAANLYAGDLLDGFSAASATFDEWRSAEAERLRRRTLRGLRTLLAQHVRDADLEAALELAERLLQLDATAEDVYQGLMRLHLARGAAGAAMREYERCRHALATRLGVQPSPATEALRRQIHARPLARPPGDADGPPVVAVLPFSHAPDAPQQAYFARGFAEDLVRELTRFRALRVLAAQSSFVEAHDHASPQAIGRRLGARYVLTGSLRHATANLRINAELLDTDRGHVLWSHRHDIAAAQLFEVQDTIARSVVATLAARIDGERLQHALRKPLDSLEAYDCWLRGMLCLRGGALDSLAEARALFERALACDPGFARAHVGLSLSYFNDWSCSAWERWHEAEHHAFEHASRAVALDDADHVTHFVLGRILLYRREFERAERHLRRAVALNPNDADMLAQLAAAYACLGQADEGIAHGRLAMHLNPYHDDWYFAYLAYPQLLARRFDEAIALALQAPHVATDIHALAAAAHAQRGELADARRHLARFLELFERRITAGRRPASGEAARWLLHVNPLRRRDDAQTWIDGLARAGLAIPDDLWDDFPHTSWPTAAATEDRGGHAA